MQVRVSITWQVIINGQVDALNVDSTPKDIGGNADTFVEVLEFFVAFDTYFIQ